MTLFEELKAANVETSSYRSDLYFEDTEASRAILAEHAMLEKQSSRFRNQVNGETWIEVPFAFDPYWESKK